MNKRLIKTTLIKFFGDNFTAYLHGLRFAYIVKTQKYLEDEPEIDLLPHLLKSGDIAIDVGANGANWTYALSKIVGEEGQVFAFEADPYYAKTTSVAIHILRLKSITMFPFGLSDNNEQVALQTTDIAGNRLSGTSHIRKNLSSSEPGLVTIKVKKLDSLLDEIPGLTKTKLIKCDVEGYELYVFKGARKLLKKARPYVILEVGNYEKQGYSAKDVFDFFYNLNYAAFSMVPGNKISPTDKTLKNDRAISENRMMIPKEKVDRIKHLTVATAQS